MNLPIHASPNTRNCQSMHRQSSFRPARNVVNRGSRCHKPVNLLEALRCYRAKSHRCHFRHLVCKGHNYSEAGGKSACGSYGERLEQMQEYAVFQTFPKFVGLRLLAFVVAMASRASCGIHSSLRFQNLCTQVVLRDHVATLLSDAIQRRMIGSENACDFAGWLLDCCSTVAPS